MVHSQSLEEIFCFFPFAIQLMVGLRIASEFCEENQKGIIYLPTATSFFHLPWQARRNVWWQWEFDPVPLAFVICIHIEGGADYAPNIGLSPPDLKIFRRAWPWRDLETAHLVFYITNTHYATCSNKKNVRENFFNFLFLTSQTSAIFIST